MKSSRWFQNFSYWWTFNSTFLLLFINLGLSVKEGMGNRGTEWGEWWEHGESGWERAESGWEREESRWECGESGWECGECGETGRECGELGWENGESGRFFVRIFVFIASARTPECEGSISPSSYYGQLPDYKSHEFCLVYQVHEFSFKEMRRFLCFFGSNVGILNIIMLMQILFYQNCKQHVHSRLAIHSMICCSANFSVREID